MWAWTARGFGGAFDWRGVGLDVEVEAVVGELDVG